MIVLKTSLTPRKRRRWFRPVLLVGSAITLVGVGVVWMIFQHKPAWYQPAIINDLTLEKAQHSFTTFVDDTSHNMVKGKPFDIVLKQQQINEWLAAWPAIIPQMRQELPDWLSESAVSFSTDLLRVGVRYDKNGWRAILNATLELSMSADGQSIVFALREVHGGSIPIPRSMLEKLLSGVIAQPPGRRSSSMASFLGQAGSIDDVYTGLTIENQFLWPNGRRHYRIASMSFHEGELRLRIDPQRR